MVIIGKDISKTRIQFLDVKTNKSKGVTIQGMDFNKIYDITKYFLEQLITYPEVKLICYGGNKNGETTLKRSRSEDNRKESQQTQENYGSITSSIEDN